MANTRSASKRAKQEAKKHLRNRINRTKVKTAIKKVLVASREENLEPLQLAYRNAVKKLSQAASKGALPKRRAARKVSRLTLSLKKQKPELFSSVLNGKG